MPRPDTLALQRPSLGTATMPKPTRPAAAAAPAPAADPTAAQRAAGAHRPGGMLTSRLGEHLVLMPGQLYFGSKAASARTLLGSCVGITLWHPQRRIGGMCHYLLPRRQGGPAAQPEGRFGEEAVGMLVQWLRLAGTRPEDYEVHLYGGADTMPGVPGARTGIGERNIEAGWQLIDQHGFSLTAVDVGETVPRNVRLCLQTGTVDMRRSAAIPDRSPR